ncbi:MAG: hypothetical protein OXC02_00305 [Rhodobacteraceae bacterium]|nr:hypothetical protein [Paracoccaceae bacterium]
MVKQDEMKGDVTLSKTVDTKPKQHRKVKTSTLTSEQIFKKTYVKRREALVALANK